MATSQAELVKSLSAIVGNFEGAHRPLPMRLNGNRLGLLISTETRYQSVIADHSFASSEKKDVQ